MNPDFKSLHEALLDAFPTQEPLERAVRFGLGCNLSTLVKPGPLADCVFELVKWAFAHERVGELLSAALGEVPGNSRLQLLYRQETEKHLWDRTGTLTDVKGGGPDEEAPSGKCLIVESDPVWVHILSECIAGMGLRCYTASSFDRALREIETVEFDLVTLDLSLDLNRRSSWGKNILARLEAAGDRVPPIIVVSGSEKLEDLADCINVYRGLVYQFVPKRFWNHDQFVRIAFEVLTSGAVTRKVGGLSRFTRSSEEVLLVHGRSLKEKDQLRQFLYALGLRAIDWAHAVELTGQTAPSIRTVVSAAFLRVSVLISLVTPDSSRALFIAGVAAGLEPERSLLVRFGRNEAAPDLTAMSVNLYNEIDSRREFAVLLRNAGCAVDLSGKAWQVAGDFG